MSLAARIMARGPYPYRRPAAAEPPFPPDLAAESRAAAERARDAVVPIEAAERDYYQRRQQGAVRESDAWPDPHGPDEAVFGPRGSVQGNGGAAVRWCLPCGVGWGGCDDECWMCGRWTLR